MKTTSASVAPSAAPTWLRRASVVVLAAYWVLIFTLTHVPPQDVPNVGGGDKLHHLLGYGLLGALLYAALWANAPRLRYAGVTVIVIGMLYGAADESLQPLVGRAAEFADWVADVAGVTLAVVSVGWMRRLLTARLITR